MLEVVVIGGREPITEAVVSRLSRLPEVACRAWTEAGGPPRDGQPGRVVYLAAARSPRGLPAFADFSACLEAVRGWDAEHLVLVGSGAAIVPSHHHPGFVAETYVPPRRETNAVAEEWLELERRAAEAMGGEGLTILRPVPILAPGGTEPFARLLSRRLAMILAGHDPTLQFLSPADLARAVEAALFGGRRGLYHVAPADVVPLRKALSWAGVLPLPLPRWLLRLARRVLSFGGRTATPDQTEYLRYSWTVSGEKIRQDLGFVPRRTSVEALQGFLQELGRKGTPGRDLPTEFDPFGMDPAYIDAYGRTLLRFLHDFYWRVELRGIEGVPETGPAVLVGMHRGFMPWDGVMALHAVARHRRRYIRFLIHPGLLKFPFLFNFMRKLGGVPANQENAQELLQGGALVGIFPEGIRGAFALYREAYQLSRFWRDDYVSIALRNRAPILPFVTVGSAEIFPILGKLESRWWKGYAEWPFIPLTPTFPWLPFPLPSKWHTWFLPPIHVEERYPPAAAADPDTVRGIDREVRGRMEEALAFILARRRSVFFGSIWGPEGEEGAEGRGGGETAEPRKKTAPARAGKGSEARTR